MRWRDLRVDYGIGPDDGDHPWWSWLPSLWRDEGRKSDDILSLQDAGQTFSVALQLADGNWLNFSFASVRTLPFSSWSQLLALAGGIAAVMILGVGAVRLITRPIESLASAAEELGRGARPGDVPEAGLNEVRQAARAFNLMQHRIRRMIEDRTQMIAAISHDLRTPITRLRLRAEFVEDPEEQQKMLADLDQMEAIIKSTLAFAREDADTEPTSPVDLAALLQEVAETHPPARLATREPCTLRARPVALRRCFNNLVENAIRYGGSAGDRDPRPARRGRGRRRRSPAPASRKTACRTSSARSCGWRNRATAIPAAPASASPSRAAWRWRMAGPSSSPTARKAASAPWSDCPRRARRTSSAGVLCDEDYGVDHAYRKSGSPLGASGRSWLAALPAMSGCNTVKGRRKGRREASAAACRRTSRRSNRRSPTQPRRVTAQFRS